MFQQNYRRLILKLACAIGLVVFVLMCARLSMSVSFLSLESLKGRESDVLRMLETGFRYDLRVGSIAFAPMLLLGMFLAMSNRLWCFFSKVLTVYTVIILLIITLAAISNYFYYSTY